MAQSTHTQNGLTSNEMGMRDLLIHNNCSQNLTGLAHFARFREHKSFFSFVSAIPNKWTATQTTRRKRRGRMEKVSRFLLLSMMTYDAILKCANSQAQYLNGTHDHKRFVLSSPSVCVCLCALCELREVAMVMVINVNEIHSHKHTLWQKRLLHSILHILFSSAV